MLAFVLATIKTGMEYDVVARIREIPGVKETYITYGAWDAVVIVEVDSLGELDRVVSAIRKIGGVEHTTTLVGV